jgi:hypothetical protein
LSVILLELLLAELRLGTRHLSLLLMDTQRGSPRNVRGWTAILSPSSGFFDVDQPAELAATLEQIPPIPVVRG